VKSQSQCNQLSTSSIQWPFPLCLVNIQNKKTLKFRCLWADFSISAGLNMNLGTYTSRISSSIWTKGRGLLQDFSIHHWRGLLQPLPNHTMLSWLSPNSEASSLLSHESTHCCSYPYCKKSDVRTKIHSVQERCILPSSLFLPKTRNGPHQASLVSF
jgi:hypothetical protein